MSDRKTGATDDQIEAAVIRHYEEYPRFLSWKDRTPEYRDRWSKLHKLYARYLVPPDQAIVSRADLRAVVEGVDEYDFVTERGRSAYYRLRELCGE